MTDGVLDGCCRSQGSALWSFGVVGVGITEKGSWGIAVPKILERARETSPAGRCHHGVAACSDLGPSGVVSLGAASCEHGNRYDGEGLSFFKNSSGRNAPELKYVDI